MKALAALLLLLTASLCWGQCPGTYHLCYSPLWTEHSIVDLFVLPDTPQYSWSPSAPDTPPLWVDSWRYSQAGGNQTWTITGIEIEPEDIGPYKGYVKVQSDCTWPWSPPQANAGCELFPSWSPGRRGLQAFRVYIHAHWDVSGADASHTVVMVGLGLPALHR
jgi:hypothetical protein